MPCKALDQSVSMRLQSQGRASTNLAQAVLGPKREWLHRIQVIVLVFRITKPPLGSKLSRVFKVGRRYERSQRMHVDGDITGHELAPDHHTARRRASRKLTWRLRSQINPDPVEVEEILPVGTGGGLLV
jgi:hypothetical protein